MKWTKGFNNNLSNVNNLNYKSQLFDARFLNELDRSQWQEIVQTVQNNVTDEVIKTAVHQLPKSIYAIDGDAITKKLISRRNDLVADAIKYYKHLNAVVKIDGTDEDERFELSGSGDSLRVQVFQKGKSNPFYNRSFSPKETK
ncbi:MAG: hypothetical protein C4329_13480 [Chitinophagaceae bacterium]